MKYLYLILALLLIYSCTTTEWQPFANKNYSTFERSEIPSLHAETLFPKPHELFVDSMIFPGRLLTIGDHLIIAENKGNYPFHIYNLKTNEYTRAGSFGQGPHELMIPWSLSPIDDVSFLVLDGIQRKVVAYNIHELIERGTSLWEAKIEEQGVAGCPIYVEGDIYYLKEVSGEQRIYKLDMETKEVSGYGVLPNKESVSIAEHVHAQAFQALMTKQDDQLIVAYRLASFIEFFDIKQGKWTAMRGPDQFKPVYKQGNHSGFQTFVYTDETPNAYLDLCASEKYTYLLYNGEVIADNEYAMQGDVIFMLNKEGKVVRQQALDVNLGAMTVYKDSLLFGIRYDITPELVKYNLKEVQKIPAQELEHSL